MPQKRAQRGRSTCSQPLPGILYSRHPGKWYMKRSEVGFPVWSFQSATPAISSRICPDWGRAWVMGAHVAASRTCKMQRDPPDLVTSGCGPTSSQDPGEWWSKRGSHSSHCEGNHQAETCGIDPLAPRQIYSERGQWGSPELHVSVRPFRVSGVKMVRAGSDAVNAVRPLVANQRHGDAGKWVTCLITFIHRVLVCASGLDRRM
ncbi:hypothetical protein IWZ03DRAFT_54468 [Phyllosticta citriasiana]|uniref:Uncharacterized protein n=1 Tax=Phyllosticta citriasiana TaxID=595635 RepID=A0ABR1KI71_9PEZI